MTSIAASPVRANQAGAVDWAAVARLVLTSRRLDELEEQQLAPAGKIAYQFSAKGHELAQVLLALALDHPHDAATVYYRSRPFALAAGLQVSEALAAGMAKSLSPSHGRDTGVSYFLPPRRGVTILPMSGNVGAQYSPAAGWAQAIQYRANIMQEPAWNGAVAAALGGDGSTAANGFWAALNIVTTLRLPMLFFIEDNGYAISVPGHAQNARANIAASLGSFANLHILEADGTEPAEALEQITSAVNNVRSGQGACLLRLSVVRLSGHSFTDNQAYKTPATRASEEARDPLSRLRVFLPDIDWQALDQAVAEEIRSGLLAAEGASDPDPHSATHYLFFEGPPQQVGGLLPEGAQLAAGNPQPATDSGPRINMLEAIRRVLESELANNPRVLVFGQDVGVKGGVHSATLDLQHKFGAARVFDTSLNEDGIIGRAAGLAYAGLLPVPEIQFRKYADPATEQINDTGWVRWRTANQFAAPMIVRIPVGFGKKTGDPWHSVSAEAVFAHTLGWRLAYPSNAADAVGLLRTALRGNDPTLFFEHRALLDTASARRPYPGDAYALPFGRAAVLQPGRSVTLITWGAMVYRCLEAAQAWPGEIEVLDLRTIVPWDQASVLASVVKTGKCLVVHEDFGTAGFGAEICATISAKAFQHLDAPLVRLASADCPIPYNLGLTESVIPSPAAISEQIVRLLAF